MAVRLAVIASVVSLAQETFAMVDCGGHFESDCDACPAGNGELWCNGGCSWVKTGFFGGRCVERLPEVIPGDSSQEEYYYLVGFVFSGITMLIFACVYNQRVIKAPPGLPKVNAFMSGPERELRDCFSYPDTCLYTTFCLPVVAGKNYYATDVCPFWPGCILSFLGTYSPFYCISAIARAVLAGRVQEKIGHKHGFFYNLMVSFFCFPCDVGRESLEIDQEIGADIRCCCSVTIIPRVVAEVAQVVEKIENKTQRACDGLSKYRVCGGQGH